MLNIEGHLWVQLSQRIEPFDLDELLRIDPSDLDELLVDVFHEDLV